MWKAIGSFAFGLVLLCSSVWAYGEKEKQTHQLSELLGTWQFIFRFGGELDKQNRRGRWYSLDRIYFDENGSPYVTGSSPFESSSLVQLKPVPSTFPENLQKYEFFMQDQGEHNGKAFCWMYVFNRSPQETLRNNFIEGVGKRIPGTRRELSDSTFTYDCPGEGTQEDFTGIKR